MSDYRGIGASCRERHLSAWQPARAHREGISRSAAIRQAVLEAASRRERAAWMRREVLRMDLGQPDGVNVAEELARDRADER
jgi:hypothetical protein